MFKCAGVALTTAVSKLQTDVTELTTYSQHSNATGKLSKMKNRTSVSRSRN